MSTSPPTLTRNHTSSSSIPQEYFLEEREEKSSSLYRRDVEPKLSNSHVFDKIRPLVCSINSSKGESSGFFINHRGTLLTVAHNIPEENANERVQFTTDYVQIDYGIQGNPYFSQPSDGIVQGHAKVLDLYSMESKIQLPESSIIPVLPEDMQLQEGMKVYFAGYPLGQDTVTFHKGTISSIIEDQGIKRFTIDIRHYRHLFQEEPRLQEIDRYSFPVGKGKALVSCQVVEKEGEKRILAKYMEVRYGNKGGGNRGIRIKLCPVLGKGTSNYKFSPNPHTAQGNYNKNQEELYLNAALKIVNHLISQKQFQQSFDFDACQATYSATLEER